MAAGEVVADGDQGHRHQGEQRQAPPDGGDSCRHGRAMKRRRPEGCVAKNWLSFALP